MAWFDMPLEQLQKYAPAEKAPKDFDAFWKKTLAEAARFPLAARFEKLDDAIYQRIDAYDMTFNGFGGQAVKGWFIEPAGNTRPLPCVITYLGYSGGRAFPLEHLWPLASGVSHNVMDTRGQGASWSPGHTPDDAGAGPAFPGWMTRGIESPQTYYYRRVFTDAARIVEAALTHPHIDPKRIALDGGSQGGGITLAAAGLCGKKIKLALVDVPFLCHFRRVITMVDSHPYSEIVSYLKCHRAQKDAVLDTLAYFDGINFAPRITARSLFSVGLMDFTCPPSTVYAAYNRVKAPKEIRVWEFNGHEGGGIFQMMEKSRFLVENL